MADPRLGESEPAWDLYRSFLAVLDAGSLSGAARALRSAQPTIGRHVEALERSLGGDPLFTRSPSGLRPTGTALALAPHARAMAVAAASLVRAATGDAQALSGVIRLTASDIVGVEVLPPMLAAFRERHPEVDIELDLSNRQEDLLRGEADIAVRMARPTQGALFAARIGAVRLVMYAHRSYLQRHGEPRTLEELTSHTLIGYDRLSPTPDTLRQIDVEVRRDLFALRTDSELAQLAALRAGFGICPCQPRIARADPNLVPILAGVLGFDLEVWVVMHEDLKSSRRMRALFDHLAEALRAYVAG